MGKTAPYTRCQIVAALVERESEFGFFFGDMQLQQTVDNPAAPGGAPIDFGQQMRRVCAVYQRNKRHDLLHFIGLQMADKVPFDI